MPPMKSLPVIQDQAEPRAPGHRSLWQSVEELEARAAAGRGEFAAGAAEVPPELSRRSFMQILGASAALAGLAACQPPREKIVPYVHEPAGGPPRQAVPLRHRALPRRLRHRAAGRQRRRAAGEGGGQPGPPGQPGRRRPPGSRARSSTSTTRSAPGATGASGQPLSWRGLLAEIQKLASGHEADGGARLAFLLAPTPRPPRPSCAAGCRPASRRPASTPGRRSPRRTPPRGPASPSAARSTSDPSLDAARVILSLDADFLSGEGESLRLDPRVRAPPGARRRA